MSWVKYVLKTSLKQKCMDWKEYQGLKRQVADAACKANLAKSSISHHCTSGENVILPHACINYRLDQGKGSKIPSLEIVYCPEFYIPNAGSSCGVLGCKLAQKNHEYHKACADAGDLRVALQVFWAKKFAKVK